MRIRRKKTLMQQAADYVEAAVEKAGPVLAEAKDRAEAALADAREQAGPVLAEAKAKAGPTLADAREKATPLIAQGAALAAEKASVAADLAAEKAAQGKELAANKAARLTSKPQKKHRLRKLLILSGLAAVIGFAVKKLQSGGDRANWQSSYTPNPPPSSRAAGSTDTPIADAAAAASGEGADVGGAGPDEALADATDESHDVTTPDEPAEVVDLEPGQEPVAKKSAKP
ncbi:MAG TPA: hypothetical protein VGK78_12690 [Nocardioides sp.]|uniref:hypothetical protein n=1 Tax=Nocardioides sp. TaxID=35761 RepID=UPI002F40DC5E